MPARLSYVAFPFLFFILNVLSCLAAYVPLRQYEGTTFFDGWAYYGNVDNTTWGNVTYLDRPGATSKRLTYVNDAGNAIVQVDNTTTLVRNADVVNRDSIRLTSLDSYGMGSLIVMDVLHIPYGCSVWPAFWTYGIEKEWPEAGEIDIIEAINDMERNQIALHTIPGCSKADTLPQSGRTLETDCSTNRGCIVAESKPNSYGPGFSDAGGGVYALLIEPTNINVWFFGRADVPSNIASATRTSSLDIESWGTPTAAYPPTRCNLTQYFPPQNLILLTTLCGVWAGNPSIYRASSCPGTCFDDNILGSGSNYANAYWEIKYVRAYTNEQPQPGATTVVTETAVPTVTVTDEPEAATIPVTMTTWVVPQTTVFVSGVVSHRTLVDHLGLFAFLLLAAFILDLVFCG